MAGEEHGERLVVLGGGALYEEDRQQVLLRQKQTGQKFPEALADYVRELRQYLKKGEEIAHV